MMQTILNDAAKLFFTYGLQRISMDDISLRLGLSKKTIYQYFKDKNDLVTQVTDHLLDEFKKVYQDSASSSSNAVHEFYLHAQQLVSNLPAIRHSFYHDVQKYYPNIWKKIMVFTEEYLTPHIENVLIKGIEQGVFRADLHIKLITAIRIQQISTIYNSNEFIHLKLHPSQLMHQLTNFYLHAITTHEGKHFIKQFYDQNNEKAVTLKA